MISDAEFERIFCEGVVLFNAHQFFEAHDKWEEAWKEVKQEKKKEPGTDPRRDFVHGLILLAVAYLHWSRHNAVGAVRKFEEALRLLEPYGPTFAGVDIRLPRAAAARQLDVLRSAPESVFHAEEVPTLTASASPKRQGRDQR